MWRIFHITNWIGFTLYVGVIYRVIYFKGCFIAIFVILEFLIVLETMRITDILFI